MWTVYQEAFSDVHEFDRSVDVMRVVLMRD